MAKKYYAVKCGRCTGIFESWDECKKNVQGYSCAMYKSFTSIEDAYKYMSPFDYVSPEERKETSEINNSHPRYFAYVDGSFNSDTHTYGYGVVLCNGNKMLEFSGCGTESYMVGMRNVAGEICGCMRAINEAIKRGFPEIRIYYDYTGIENWATGNWKANKRGTQQYSEFIVESRKKIDISFEHVAAHTGIELNERVDEIAKKAAGVL